MLSEIIDNVLGAHKSANSISEAAIVKFQSVYDGTSIVIVGIWLRFQ